MDTTDASTLDGADMQRLAGGHDAALNDLMARHALPVFQFLCRMLGNEEDANDLAQETFLRVYQHRASFKPGARFTTWLYTIAANLARNHYRWRTRHPNISLDAESEATGQSVGDALPCSAPAPDSAADTTERAAAVRAEVERLPADMREVIILCEWQDLSAAEAATILDTTPKAIDNRLYRARNLLRERLTKWV
ncbi:MAG: RNA polymerase sigma factor [Verrucomicrobiota bacterium]